jgi:ribulose-5-phosphate 4-epimerase/fuculose-1-phosphate aldolase
MRSEELRSELCETLRRMAAGGLVLDGAVVEGPRPSVHTHSPYATAVSCVLDEIPTVEPEQEEVVGGALPVASPAPSGGAALGEAVLAAARERWAAVVRNHGPVCFGRDLAGALACAFAVEENARIYALARLLKS